MKEEKKSSIIKEALIDFNTITEAADANAKKRLAEEFPDSFNKLLKEELNKNKAKESYKKLDNAKESEKSDDTKTNKESDMKNQVEETVKVVNTVGKGEPFDTKAKKVQEDVKVTDTVGKSDPFTEKKKGTQKIEEEREKDFVADIESDTPNQSKNDKGVAFKEKIKAPTSGKPMSNLKEEFNLSGLESSSVNGALDNASEDDEIITMDEIENQISEMEGLNGIGEELSDMAGLPQQTAAASPEGQGGDAYAKLVGMRNELDEMIKSMGGAEQNEAMGLQPDQMNPNEFNAGEAPIAETELYEEAISDEDINNVLGSNSEVPVDEAMGISHSNGTVVTGKLGDHEGTHGRFRQTQNESIKLGGLIEENKKLTKKLNEVKKEKETVKTLVESYKNALEKYRNQLKEMAIFNTNLAHVNNLLVNESLALTQDDKIKIINDFKKVDSITESQNKYKSFLTEMKETKKPLTESIVEKVSTSIQPSSKQKLDEVVEKTAYANNKHIDRMKEVMRIIENRGKK